MAGCCCTPPFALFLIPPYYSSTHGRLLAILGPSGSGKTTLLNTISGQLPYQVIDDMPSAASCLALLLCWMTEERECAASNSKPKPTPTHPQPHMRLTGGVYVTEEERPPPPPTPSDASAAATTTTGRRKRTTSGSGFGSSSNAGGFVFVRQEDLFYSQLTVRETLQFTSRLRLPRGVPDKEKCAAVEEMLSRMGLLEVGVCLCF